VLALPAPTPEAVYVIEVSSYQLDLTTTFAPDVAILTNISPDHLDRHGGMEGYVKAKARLFQSQDKDAIALIGVDEDWGQKLADEVEARGQKVRRIATARTEADLPPTGWRASASLLLAGDQRIDLSDARSLPGRHNAQNAAFAYATAVALGVKAPVALEGLKAFPGLAHRMEAVGRLDDVRFINDSKGTNADAAAQALASYPRVFWIAGGKAKDGGIESLRPLFDHITKAYLIGEAADAFAVTLADVPHVVATTMERAVQMASDDAAVAGGEQVVLLSPACASFDQFPDFEVRGEAFRAAVLALGATSEGAL